MCDDMDCIHLPEKAKTVDTSRQDDCHSSDDPGPRTSRENNPGMARHGLAGRSTNACLCQHWSVISIVYYIKYFWHRRSFHTLYLISALGICQQDHITYSGKLKHRCLEKSQRLNSTQMQMPLKFSKCEIPGMEIMKLSK